MAVKSCSVCGSNYIERGEAKNFPFHPMVCSKACFISLLGSRKPEEFTKVPNKYTDTMLKFEDSEINMRSNYERGVAKWLRDNGFIYFYEPYLFYLSGYHGYVPDFFLPYSNLFLEVKGRWEGNAFLKYKKFRKEYNHYILLIDKDIMGKIQCKPIKN